MLELMHKHMDAKGKQAKLKSPAELQVSLVSCDELSSVSIAGVLDQHRFTPLWSSLVQCSHLCHAVGESGHPYPLCYLLDSRSSLSPVCSTDICWP